MKFKIRYAKKSDIDFLIQGMEDIRTIEKKPDWEIKARSKDKNEFLDAIKKKYVRVIETNNTPVAYSFFKPNFKLMCIRNKVFWLQTIYVKKTERGKGLGGMLHRDIVKICKKYGFNEVYCDIFDININSKKYHTQKKFKPVYTIYKKKI